MFQGWTSSIGTLCLHVGHMINMEVLIWNIPHEDKRDTLKAGGESAGGSQTSPPPGQPEGETGSESLL